MSAVLDTIAALATPPGRGGVGIVRVSGPQVVDISKKILTNLPVDRVAHYGPFLDKNSTPMDYGIALYFKGPNSFTGEDVLELQGHGGPVVMKLLLETVYAHGARAAGPGEFSERAFLNGKMDLTQAEAIADLIDAHSESAAKAALGSLCGVFKTKVGQLQQQIIDLRVYVEAAIDFPEEEIDFLADEALKQRVKSLEEAFASLIQSAEEGAKLRQGFKVVLCGAPNAGKSTLMNYLAQMPMAIVTDIPGTTRDVIRAEVVMDGVCIEFVDTAGIRESTDLVETLGVERSLAEVKTADVVLLLASVDEPSQPSLQAAITEQGIEPAQLIEVTTKIDQLDGWQQTGRLGVSAVSGEGISALKQQVVAKLGDACAHQSPFMGRARHVTALKKADGFAKAAIAQLDMGFGECVAKELADAHGCLGEIVGSFGSDDLLGEIFSSFCIGK